MTDESTHPPADELDPEQAELVIKAIEEVEKKEAEEQANGQSTDS